MNPALFACFTAFAIFCATLGEAPECQRPPRPAFLDGANETVRQEFHSIFENHALAPEARRSQVIELGKKYGLEDEATKYEDMVKDVMSKNPPNCVHPVPEFLKNANETVRSEFFQIVKDHSLTRDQKKAKILEWAKQFGPEFEAQVKQHEEMEAKHKVGLSYTL
ncbi:hypothetical protein COOONC_03129 [Cooperia oncophora]